MILNDFNNFLNENSKSEYKLYIETGGSEEMWNITMDIRDIWKEYHNKKIDLINFINKYKLRINEYKNILIEKKGINIWNDLANILNDFKIYDNQNSHIEFDKIYDWGDKNNIEIKT